MAMKEAELQLRRTGKSEDKRDAGIIANLRNLRGEDVYSETTETPVIPEGAIRFPDLTIGGKTPGQLERELASGGFRASDYARYLLRSRDFTTLSDQQTLSLVRVNVSDLGLTGNPTIGQIYAKARSFGWELCPAEVGPHLRLAYKEQPLNEWLYVGMKQIFDSGGYPVGFELGRREGGSWLGGSWAYPGRQWDPEYGFVFSLRK